MIANVVLHADRRMPSVTLLNWCAALLRLRLPTRVAAAEHAVCDAPEGRATLVTTLVRRRQLLSRLHL